MKRLIIVLILFSLLSPVLAQELTVRVGFYDNPPKMYVNETTGSITGFHIQIIQAIAEREGWHIEYVIGTFNELLEKLSRNELDVLVDVAYSDERAKLYDFNNESVLDTWGTVYSRIGFSPQSILDLEGKKIGVMRGSIYTTDFINLVKQFDLSVELVTVENYTAVFELIHDGVVDAGIANRLFAAYTETYQVQSTNIIFSPVKLKYAFPKGAALNSILIKGIDENIIYFKENKFNVYYTALNEMLGQTYDNSALLLIFYVSIGIILLVSLIVIVYLYASRREIGLRLEAERKLKESEARFYKTFQKAPVGILILDTLGKIIDTNPKCTEITGYDKNRFIGKNLLYLSRVLRTDLRKALGQFSEIVKGKSIKTAEFIIKNKNGDNVFILSTPAFIKEEKKVILLIEDITERKESETALIKKEKEFREIFETSPELIIVLDNNGKLIKMNDRMLEWSGYSKEYFLGKGLLSMPFTSNSKIKVMKAFAKRMMGQTVEPYEVEFVSKNKELKTGLINGTLIRNDKGKAVADLAMISDVTKQKELEALKNNFIMLTTHDLKQPLMPILGYADLLKGIVTDEKGKEYLSKITDSSYHMRDMVNKILNLFKIEEGQLLFDMSVNNLSKTINEVLDYKNAFINLKGLKIINKLGLNVKAKFDPERLRDVFVNLIDNAIKFTSKGGSITVKTWAFGSKAYASIKDSGIGLKKIDMDNLFKKFYQSAEGKALGGSGIGLALVKKIIDAHKGNIKVKSVYGKGAEFIIELPVK